MAKVRLYSSMILSETSHESRCDQAPRKAQVYRGMFLHQRRSRGGGRSSRRTSTYSFRRIDNKSESFVPKRDNVSSTQEEEKKVHSVFFARLCSVSSIRSYATFTVKVQTLRPAVFCVLTFIPYFSLPIHRIVLALDHLPQRRAKRRTAHRGFLVDARYRSRHRVIEAPITHHFEYLPSPYEGMSGRDDTFMCAVEDLCCCMAFLWRCVSESHVR